MSMQACPKCGSPMLAEQRTCAVCGYTPMAGEVVLRSLATEDSCSFKVSLPVGAKNLEKLNDPDVRYAASPQFHLIRDEQRGGWVVRNDPQAPNPLWLNDHPIPSEGTVLQGGEILSLKGKALHLEVILR